MPVDLDALGPNGPYRARNRLPIPDVSGEPVAELSLVPKLFVTRAMSALRKAGSLATDERTALIAHAGTIFAQGTVAGLSPAGYEDIVSRVSGMPISVVRAAANMRA